MLSHDIPSTWGSRYYSMILVKNTGCLIYIFLSSSTLFPFICGSSAYKYAPFVGINFAKLGSLTPALRASKGEGMPWGRLATLQINVVFSKFLLFRWHKCISSLEHLPEWMSEGIGQLSLSIGVALFSHEWFASTVTTKIIHTLRCLPTKNSSKMLSNKCCLKYESCTYFQPSMKKKKSLNAVYHCHFLWDFTLTQLSLVCLGQGKQKKKESPFVLLLHMDENL